MLTREDVRRLALEAKGRLDLTWPQLGEAVGRPRHRDRLLHPRDRGCSLALMSLAEPCCERIALRHECFGRSAVQSIELLLEVGD